MSIPRWYAGQVITADRLNARNTYMVTQESDMNVDQGAAELSTEIVVPLESGAVYSYTLLLSYSATNNSDSALDWWWNVPAGTLFARFTQSYEQDPTTGINDGQTVILRRPGNTTRIPAGGTGIGNFHSAFEHGTITVGSTTGNATLVVAQNVHGGTPSQTILRGGNQTRFLYQRIG